jgi:hypothetical protein
MIEKILVSVSSNNNTHNESIKSVTKRKVISPRECCNLSQHENSTHIKCFPE